MPHTISRAALFACACLLPTLAAAQDASGTVVEDVVVTASRTGPVRAGLLGSSATVLSPAQLEERQALVVSDVLRDVPGVSIGRTGAVGNLTQVRIRGAEANHTLTLIDGIEASDPFQGEFNYAALTADDAIRIEVLRGQQSALYGSDAIGGVVHYITLSGVEAPGVRLRSETGSFHTWQGSARVAGGDERFDYALTGGYFTTRGFPTATTGDRDIGAKLGSGGAKVNWSPLEALKITAVGRYSSTVADMNSESYFPVFEVVDSPGKYATSEAWYGLVSAQLNLLDDRWTNIVSVQGTRGERHSFNAAGRNGGDKGGREKASLQSTYRFGDVVQHALTAAVDLEREMFQNTASASAFGPDTTRRHIDNTGAVLEYQLTTTRLGLGAAWRHDDNDLFQDADTYRLQASFGLTDSLRLRGAAGTGIRNPGQTELFGYNAGLYPFVGNPDLKPEKSKGWEIGLEHRLLGGRLRAGATYFESTLTNEIYTDFAASPNTARNRGVDSHQKGVEVEAHARLSDAWLVDVVYAYLDADEDGVREIRRAPHSGSINVSWRAPSDRFGAVVTARYIGESIDTDFAAFETVDLPEALLLNVGGDYRLTDKVRVYGRVENLLDEDYQEVLGYRTGGRAAYVGLRARF